jgi:anthranilate/para-aminobenzoate synthase component I
MQLINDLEPTPRSFYGGAIVLSVTTAPAIMLS